MASKSIALLLLFLFIYSSESLECKWICATSKNWNEISCWSCNQIPNNTTDVVIENSSTVTILHDASALSLTLNQKSTLFFGNLEEAVVLTVLNRIYVGKGSLLTLNSNAVEIRGRANPITQFEIDGTANGLGLISNFNMTVGVYSNIIIKSATYFGRNVQIFNQGTFSFNIAQYSGPFPSVFINDGILRFYDKNQFNCTTGRLSKLTNYKLIEVNDVTDLCLEYYQGKNAKLSILRQETPTYFTNSIVDIGGEVDLGDNQLYFINSSVTRRDSSSMSHGVVIFYATDVELEPKAQSSLTTQEFYYYSSLMFMEDTSFLSYGISIKDTVLLANLNKINISATLYSISDLTIKAVDLRLESASKEPLLLMNDTLISSESSLVVPFGIKCDAFSQFSGEGLLDVSGGVLQLDQAIKFDRLNLTLSSLRLMVDDYFVGNFISTDGKVKFRPGSTVTIVVDSPPISPSDSFGIIKFGTLMSEVPKVKVVGNYSCLGYSLEKGLHVLEYFFGLPNFPQNSSVSDTSFKFVDSTSRNISFSWSDPILSCNISVSSTRIKRLNSDQVWIRNKGENSIVFKEKHQQCQTYNFEISQSFQWTLFPQVFTTYSPPAKIPWAYDSGLIQKFVPNFYFQAEIRDVNATFRLKVDKSIEYPCDAIPTHVQITSISNELNISSPLLALDSNGDYSFPLPTCRIWNSNYRVFLDLNGVQFASSYSNNTTDFFLVEPPASLGVVSAKQGDGQVTYSWGNPKCNCGDQLISSNFSIKFMAEGTTYFFFQSENSIKLEDYSGSKVTIQVYKACQYATYAVTSESSSLELVTKKSTKESKTMLIVVGSFFSLLVLVAVIGCFAFVIRHFVHRKSDQEEEGETQPLTRTLS